MTGPQLSVRQRSDPGREGTQERVGMKDVNEVPTVEKHSVFSGRAKPLEIPHGRRCRHLPVVLSLKEKRRRGQIGHIAFDSNVLLFVEQGFPRALEPVPRPSALLTG